jgi:hypothetical protein
MVTKSASTENSKKLVLTTFKAGLGVLSITIVSGFAAVTPPESKLRMLHQMQETAPVAAPLTPDLRGTEQKPLIVREITVPVPPESVTRREADAAEHAYNERLTTYSTVGLALVTALLAVFTFLLWYANRKLVLGADITAERQAREMQASIAEATRSATAVEQLAEATKKNASLMSDILHKQMRAYVSVESGAGVYQDDKNNFGSYPKIVNTGLSPARNVSHRVRAAILDANTPRDFAFPEPTALFSNDVTLASHQSFTMTAVVGDRYNEDEVIEIMKADKRRVFVWGSVMYDDVFGGHWETRFCHSYGFVKVGDEMKVNSWYHAGHNSST